MRRTGVNSMADDIMKGLLEYADASSEMIKKAVKETGETVKEDISAHAPKRTGKYKKSFTVTKLDENSAGMTVAVHSKNRYQLTHLLEKGHAKRGGGRAAAIPHIEPAEQRGIKQLREMVERGLSK